MNGISKRGCCLPISTSGVYTNGSFARGAEKQKNKLADDGGGLITITIVFTHHFFLHHCFHLLLFTHASFLQPFTHRSL